MDYLNLAAIRFNTTSEGPGHRIALWVQGCDRKCKGCCNPEMQEFKAAHIVVVDDFINLLEQKYDKKVIEGISLIGGEPFYQAKGLWKIAKWAKDHNLSVLTFTGFLYQELLAMRNPDVHKLLSYTDLLVDGPFIGEEYDLERAWIGSKNQKVYRLSDFYPAGIEYESKEKSMEIRVSAKDILVNGWPF